jgi:hypothetical protein
VQTHFFVIIFMLLLFLLALVFSYRCRLQLCVLTGFPSILIKLRDGNFIHFLCLCDPLVYYFFNNKI